MRLARLLLEAYGPFTDTVVDFAAGPSDLHLIYGPNEAGKSSALRAMTDLRFGIPLRSPDDFVHPSNRLRISGVFIDAGGEPVRLTRRKGRGATLSRADPDGAGQGEPGAHELALTGGLTRAEFEAMFGLNHARLREGGERLLTGEGELGAALFEASAGTRGIAAILAELDADAKKLYNPHGGARNAIINEARRALETERQAFRQAQTRPAEWQGLKRAHEAAEAAQADLDRALETLRRRENELTELRTVEPLLREHDRVQAELEALAGVPDLPETAREERLAAEQGLRRAEQDLREAEAESSACAEAQARLVIEPAVLDHAEAIERLAAGIEPAAQSHIDAHRERAGIARIEEDLGLAAARLAPGVALPAILDAVPSGADRVALDQHLMAYGRQGARLEGYRERAEALDRAIEEGAVDIPVPADPQARRDLSAALRRAQVLGDVTRQAGELERQIGALDHELAQALSDLDCGSADTLGRSRPLLEAEIALAWQARAENAEARRAARDEDRRLARDLEGQRLRQRQLEAQGEVVTAETLYLARARRDRGWALVRRAYVLLGGDPEVLGRGFDPERALPEAFEAAQSEADRQADVLRADAVRAAGVEDCALRIEQMQARRAELATAIEALDAEGARLATGWAERLARARLPRLEAEALREWQGRRQAALSLAERLAELRADQDRLQDQASAAAGGLGTALAAMGEALPADGGLGALIEQAERADRQATETEAELGARARAARTARLDRDRIGVAIAEAESALGQHAAALRAWHARLFLPAGGAPEAIKARLEELDAVARQFQALCDARLRLAHHEAFLVERAAQAARLAAVLGEPAPGALEDYADRLKRRLAASREQDHRRALLIRDRLRAEEGRRRAESEREAQSAALARLCRSAGVESIDGLPEREAAAARKRQSEAALSRLRQQLAQASARSEPALRAALASQDAIAIEGERERCRTEIERREHEQLAARRAEEEARHALEAIDGSDRAAAAREAMESAAARYRSAVRPWARLRLAHALLTEALKRFRERAEAPMVESASRYFSLMTGGRYQRLVADEEDLKPVLRAERAGGGRIGVEAMSDGTADQLYLALRLAALELRRAPEMPLLLDDVLVTSDDERSGMILRALSRFAEGRQVMLFTHHRHLIEVARLALGDRGVTIHTL